MQVYQDTQGSEAFHTAEDFTEHRLRLRKGDGLFRDSAVEHPWQVSDDAGITFREPSVQERAELNEMIWATRRETTFDCYRKCSDRVQIDDLWWCRSCSSLWVSEVSDKSYGRQLIQSAAFARVRELVAQLRQDNPLPIEWQPDYLELDHEVETQANAFINAFFRRRTEFRHLRFGYHRHRPAGH